MNSINTPNSGASFQSTVMAEATQCQTLKKGDEFCSLVLLEEAIKKFEDNENCNLSKFNTRTIEGAKRKGLKIHLNPELEYACLNYMRVQGGEYKVGLMGYAQIKGK
ncbi:hypothetical protein ACI65C_004858 [Semiaphis heraclei]